MPATIHHLRPATPAPDPAWSAIALDLVRIGGDPDDLYSLPGMDPETASEMAGLMQMHAAAGVEAIALASR